MPEHPDARDVVFELEAEVFRLRSERDEYKRHVEYGKEAIARWASEVERLREALTRALDTGDWYVRCLEDVQDGFVVRALLEAKLGWTNALHAAREALEAGEQG